MEKKSDEKAVGRRFSDFYEKWMAQLEDLLHQLLKAINSKDHQNHRNESADVTPGDRVEQLETLVSKVTTHQKQYYVAKWEAAHEDVLAFYAPSWLSPLEIAYSWVTGWKPSMAFRVLDSLKKRSKDFEDDEERARRMGELRTRIRAEEEKVEREMERQQVAMGDRRIVDLVKLSSQRYRGVLDSAEEEEEEEKMVEVGLKGLKSGLEKVMKAADCVRLKTLKGVLDILNPRSGQCVEFLAAAFLLQIQLGRWGTGRDQILASPLDGSRSPLF